MSNIFKDSFLFKNTEKYVYNAILWYITLRITVFFFI